jgi:methyl-accepting chemotaxis protein
MVGGRSALAVAVVGIWLAALGSAWLGSQGATEQLLRGERELFSTLRHMRTAQLANYFGTTIDESRFWAQNRIMRGALLEFSAAWNELGPAASETLQRLYIANNPYLAGERDNFERASDGSTYSDVHARYHFWLRSFLLHRGIYDVFLFDAVGNVVYSSFKEEEFATNLVDGPWSDTSLGRAFVDARDNPFPSHVSVLDFAPYAPSHGAPAMFTASPVLDDDGTFLGVIAFQLPVERINAMLREVGLRQTGKTYLVGPDLHLRSRTRYSETASMLETEVGTDTARAALAGEAGQHLTTDYRGVPVLSTFAPLEIGDDLRWAVLSELDEAEYRAPSRAIRNRALLLAAGIALILSGLLLGWVRLRSRSR